MPRKSKKQYSFPILKRKEIIKCLKELGININEIDLKQPHEEKCKIIYSSILSKIMGINVLTKQIPYNKLSIFSYPSLHESSILNVRLICQLIKFMQKVGVTDFSISDLISPESSRTIRNLSAIINFARWKQHKNQIYEERKLKIQELNKLLLNNKSENELLAKEFVKMNEKMEIEKPQILNLKSELNELHNLLETNNVEMERRGDIAHNIKKQIKKLKTIEMEKKAILNKNIDIIHNLQSKIVKSPQRIKKELKLLSNKIEKEKINISINKEKLKYDENKLFYLKNLIEIINKRINEMKKINILKNEKFIKYEQEISKLLNLKNSFEKELKSIIKQHKTQNIKLNKQKNNFSILQQEHQTKKNQVDVKHKQIENLKKQHSQKRVEKQRKISNYDKQIESKKESINNLLKHNKISINEINLKYKKLAHSVAIYHKNMEQGMDQW